MRIDIETLSDEHDCETCGGSYATGGIVKVDGREFFRFEPFAYCFDEKSLEPDDLLAIVLDLVREAVQILSNISTQVTLVFLFSEEVRDVFNSLNLTLSVVGWVVYVVTQSKTFLYLYIRFKVIVPKLWISVPK